MARYGFEFMRANGTIGGTVIDAPGRGLAELQFARLRTGAVHIKITDLDKTVPVKRSQIDLAYAGATQ